MTQLTEFDKIDIEDALKKLSISSKIALLGGKVSNHLRSSWLLWLTVDSEHRRTFGASKMSSKGRSRCPP